MDIIVVYLLFASFYVDHFCVKWFYCPHIALICRMMIDYMVLISCVYVDGLVQDCSNSSALAMELLQSYTKPSICSSLKTESCHDANFVVTGGTVCCPYGSGATSDDKVSIMATLSFQCSCKHLL